MSPGPLTLVVTPVVGGQLPVDDIRDASFQCSDCFLLGFAFVLFLVLVGPPGTGRFADLGYGGHVDGMVEDPVASQAEPMFDAPT